MNGRIAGHRNSVALERRRCLSARLAHGPGGNPRRWPRPLARQHRRLPGSGLGYVVARLALDFRAPASLGERVLFGSFAVEHVGSSSIRLQERLTTNSGSVVVEAVSVIVAWDQDQAVGRPLTGAEKAALTCEIAPAHGVPKFLTT